MPVSRAALWSQTIALVSVLDRCPDSDMPCMISSIPPMSSSLSRISEKWKPWGLKLDESPVDIHPKWRFDGIDRFFEPEAVTSSAWLPSNSHTSSEKIPSGQRTLSIDQDRCRHDWFRRSFEAEFQIGNVGMESRGHWFIFRSRNEFA